MESQKILYKRYTLLEIAIILGMYSSVRDAAIPFFSNSYDNRISASISRNFIKLIFNTKLMYLIYVEESFVVATTYQFFVSYVINILFINNLIIKY